MRCPLRQHDPYARFEHPQRGHGLVGPHHPPGMPVRPVDHQERHEAQQPHQREFQDVQQQLPMCLYPFWRSALQPLAVGTMSLIAAQAGPCEREPTPMIRTSPLTQTQRPVAGQAVRSVHPVKMRPIHPPGERPSTTSQTRRRPATSNTRGAIRAHFYPFDRCDSVRSSGIRHPDRPYRSSRVTNAKRMVLCWCLAGCVEPAIAASPSS